MINRMRGSRRWAAAAAVIALVGSTLLFSAAPAAAAPGPVYGAFTLAGTGGLYTGTMTLPAAFPAAMFTSNARADATVPSGASAFLSAAIPFGQLYGSSQNKGYLNLRPAADNASSPSTTTYAFASPTPAAGWGFVLADVDADQDQVQATGPGVKAVPSPTSGSRVSSTIATSHLRAPVPAPVWSRRRPSDLGSAHGNPQRQRSGAGHNRSQRLVPTEGAAPHTHLRLHPTFRIPRLLNGVRDAHARVVGHRHDRRDHPARGRSAGNPGLRGHNCRHGHHRRGRNLEPGRPGSGRLHGAGGRTAGYQPVGPSERDANLVALDATGVNFDLTLITYPARGTVTADGAPVSGVTVTCLDPTGMPIGSALTDSSGAYACAPVPPGTGYSVVLSVPAGYAADGPVARIFDFVDAAVTGLDFALTVPPPITTETSSTATTVTTATTETATSGATTPDTTTPYTTAPDTTTTDTTSEDITPDTTTSDTTTSDSTRTVTLAVTWSIASAVSDEFVLDQTYDTSYDAEQSDVSALATTGSPVESLLPVGAVSVIGGGLLVLFGRRRRGAHR